MTAKKNVFAQAARDAKDGMEVVMTGEKKHAGKARAEYHTTGVRLPNDLWRKCQLHRVETGESFNALAVRAIAGALENEDEE